MNSTIQSSYGTWTYDALTKALGAKGTGTPTGSFFDLIAQGSRETAGMQTTDAVREMIPEGETSKVDTYLKHLESKYGNVTIEDVGRDRESLEKIGKRMRGNDVVIAPNILENMANDVKTAAYYEQKIDYFFNTVIPRESAVCAARGQVFEPCGVVVHKDGSVTYICGCSDSPERVAEVNRINRERDAKRAERRKLYQEQAVAMAEFRRAIWEQSRQTARAELDGLTPAQPLSAPDAVSKVACPNEAELFFLDL